MASRIYGATAHVTVSQFAAYGAPASPTDQIRQASPAGLDGTPHQRASLANRSGHLLHSYGQFGFLKFRHAAMPTGVERER
jgi:hypothetical protein